MEGVSSVMANNIVITAVPDLKQWLLPSMCGCVRKMMEGRISI